MSSAAIGIAAIALVLAAVGIGGLAAATHSSRNRLLQRFLPRIQRELAARAGGMTVERLSLDAGWRLRADRVVLTFGDAGRLDVESAELTGVLEFVRTRKASALVLERGTGTLRLGGDLADPILLVPLTFEREAGGTPDAGAIAVHGRVRTESARWKHEKRGETAFTGSAGFRIAGGRWWVDAATLEARVWSGGVITRDVAGSCKIEGDVSGGLSSPQIVLTGKVSGADASAIAAWMDGSGVPEPMPPLPAGTRSPARGNLALPPDLVADADFRWKSEQAVSADIVVRTPRESRATATFQVGLDGGVEGPTAGKLAMDDVVALGFLPPEMSGSPVSYEGRVWGRLDDTKFEALLKAEQATFTLPAMAIPLEKVTARIQADKKRVDAPAIGARLHDGTISGRTTFAFEAKVHDGVFTIEGVRANRLAGLERFLRGGALGGEVSWLGRGLGVDKLALDSKLAIDSPLYVLDGMKQKIDEWGLTAPDARGDAPLSLTLRLQSGSASIRDLAASLRGVKVKGSVTIDFVKRGLQGKGEISLGRELLSTSSLLSIPAALSGSLTVPIAVGGTIDKPTWEADLFGTLDRFLADTPVGKAVHGAMDGMWVTLAGRALDGMDLDMVLGWILRGGKEGDRWMRKLIDSGIPASEVERMLDDYRSRHPK